MKNIELLPGFFAQIKKEYGNDRIRNGNFVHAVMADLLPNAIELRRCIKLIYESKAMEYILEIAKEPSLANVQRQKALECLVDFAFMDRQIATVIIDGVLVALYPSVSTAAPPDEVDVPKAKEVQSTEFDILKACFKASEEDIQIKKEEFYEKGQQFYAQQQYIEAVKWYRKAAEQRHAQAQFILGYCYDHGKGVTQDHTEAEKWYRHAAEQGYEEATKALSRLRVANITKPTTPAHKQDSVEKTNNKYGKDWLFDPIYKDDEKETPCNYTIVDNVTGEPIDPSRYTLTIDPVIFGRLTKSLANVAEKAANPERKEYPNDYYCKGNECDDNSAYEEAVSWYRKAAELGHAEAQYRMGKSYYEGKGAERDYAEAEKWYRKAAEQGSAVAQAALKNLLAATSAKPVVLPAPVPVAIMQKEDPKEYYAKGMQLYGQRNYSDAVAYLRRAAELGYAEAENMLGECYYRGEGVTRDYAEAVKWLSKAAERNCAWAQYNLGICYYNGEGIAKDFMEAAKWWREAAGLRLFSAQYELGECYYKGEGVIQDYSEAVKWYRKAAQGTGWPKDAACNKLGHCYYYGYGVARNYADAVKWYLKAESQKDAEATSNLGNCYYEGKGVKTDYAEAVKWYKLSEDHAESQYRLGDCCRLGRGVKKDLVRAAYYYCKAAERDHGLAQVQMGNCYYYGKGVKKDYAQAVKWYSMAEKHHCHEAFEMLGKCYYYGRGVTKDKVTANEMLYIAKHLSKVHSKNAPATTDV